MKYRHKKRGTEYFIIEYGVMQESRWNLLDDLPVVIYQDINGGPWYVRPECEFFDGRFEELE